MRTTDLMYIVPYIFHIHNFKVIIKTHLYINTFNMPVRQINPKTMGKWIDELLFGKKSSPWKHQVIYHTTIDHWTGVEISDKAFPMCCTICRSETGWFSSFKQKVWNRASAFERINPFLCVWIHKSTLDCQHMLQPRYQSLKQKLRCASSFSSVRLPSH